jgi:pseudo-rSAM protein
VQNEDDCCSLEDIFQKIEIENFNFSPYFNGKNVSFFEKNIFLNQDDLLAICVDKNSIFTKEVLNVFDFGKITIMPNGDAFANLNLPKIGNIDKESLGKIIFNELASGTSWRRIRNFAPCNQCTYKILCPSPSNYDFAFNKPNLCNIVEP